MLTVPTSRKGCKLEIQNLTRALLGRMVIHQVRTNRVSSGGDISFKVLTYQLPVVRYWLAVAMTGNRELGFDSGEGA